MSNSLRGEQIGKVRQLNYETFQPNSPSLLKKQQRASSLGRNPIKIVVDIIGEDGAIHQKIINQQREDMNSQSKLNSFRVSKSLDRQRKTQFQPFTQQGKAQPKPILARSLVFNRFRYDNYQQLPIPNTLKSKSKSHRALKPGHKNIEIVFCESKYPEFIQKTNAKIEDLYKQEQLKDQNYHRHVLKSSINLAKTEKRISPRRQSQKTNLANCLKEYATLEKLSMFMESDQRRREACLCYTVQKDHSRNLLLDIITHRFNFLKTMNRRCRQSIYKILLGREVNALTKINIQEYMKISEMFVGRDASNIQLASFMYLFLFGERPPTIDMAHQKLQALNGQLHKMKAILQELYQLLTDQNSAYLVDELSKRERLLRLFIDYIIERG